MNPDGRTGYGAMKKARPASYVLFSFAAGKPMKVTRSIDLEPKVGMVLGLATDHGPRYACLGGVDSFGRATEGRFTDALDRVVGCSVAYGY
ncbi:hypothetical protein ACQEU6_46130 [Spirillospora sp. CA-108201]